MENLRDTGSLKEIQAIRGPWHPRRRDDEPVAAREGAGRLKANLKKICEIVKARERRSGRDRFRRHDARSHDIARSTSNNGRQGAAHARRHSGLQDAVGRGIKVNVTLLFSPGQALLAARPARPSSAVRRTARTNIGTNGMS